MTARLRRSLSPRARQQSTRQLQLTLRPALFLIYIYIFHQVFDICHWSRFVWYWRHSESLMVGSGKHGRFGKCVDVRIKAKERHRGKQLPTVSDDQRSLWYYWSPLGATSPAAVTLSMVPHAAGWWANMKLCSGFKQDGVCRAPDAVAARPVPATAEIWGRWPQQREGSCWICPACVCVGVYSGIHAVILALNLLCQSWAFCLSDQYVIGFCADTSSSLHEQTSSSDSVCTLLHAHCCHDAVSSASNNNKAKHCWIHSYVGMMDSHVHIWRKHARRQSTA